MSASFLAQSSANSWTDCQLEAARQHFQTVARRRAGAASGARRTERRTACCSPDTAPSSTLARNWAGTSQQPCLAARPHLEQEGEVAGQPGDRGQVGGGGGGPGGEQQPGQVLPRQSTLLAVVQCRGGVRGHQTCRRFRLSLWTGIADLTAGCREQRPGGGPAVAAVGSRSCLLTRPQSRNR